MSECLRTHCFTPSNYISVPWYWGMCSSSLQMAVIVCTFIYQVFICYFPSVVQSKIFKFKKIQTNETTRTYFIQCHNFFFFYTLICAMQWSVFLEIVEHLPRPQNAILVKSLITRFSGQKIKESRIFFLHQQFNYTKPV